MNAAGKEASPAIPSPAFYVWGAPDLEVPVKASHLTSTSVNPNIIKQTYQTVSTQEEVPKPAAQQIPTIPECVENHDSPTNGNDNNFPAISQSPTVYDPPPITDDPNNFPSLADNDNFPSLASSTNTGPTKGRGKKGRGKKGQQLLTLGVQRMSIN